MKKRLSNGLAIKALREAYGYPGGVFASQCLISHAYLVNIEKDRRHAPPELMRRIADKLGVPVAAISSIECPCSHCQEDVA